MTEKIVRFIKGYTGIRLEGGFPDGFFDECRKRGVDFYDIRERDGCIYLFTSDKNTDILRETGEKAGMDFSVTGKFGLKQMLIKNKFRIVFACGLLLTAIITGIMYMRIWSIEITGCEKLFTSEVTELCNELGLRVGVKKKDITATKFQESLILKSGGRISFASLNVEGMCAELIIKESVPPPSGLLEKTKPCNIIADFDGEIKSVRVFSGAAECKKGDGVHKGDLLISGTRENEYGVTCITAAKGQITARHTVKIKPESVKRGFKKCTKVKTAYGISIFGKAFSPKKILSKGQVTLEERFFVLNGITLPFSVKKYISSHYGEEAEISESTEKALELRDYLEAVRKKTLNSNVLNEKSSYANGYSGSIDCLDFIGKQQIINLE